VPLWNSGRRASTWWPVECARWEAWKHDFDRRFAEATIAPGRVDPARLPALEDEAAALQAAYARIFVDEAGRWEPYFPDALITAMREALRRLPVSEALLEALFRATAGLVAARTDTKRGVPALSGDQVAELEKIRGRIRALQQALGVQPGLSAPETRAEMARIEALVGGWAAGLLRHVETVAGLVEALQALEAEVGQRLANRGRRRGPGQPTDHVFAVFLADVIRACWDHGLAVKASPGGPADRLVRVLVAAVPGERCREDLARHWLPEAVHAARAATADTDLVAASLPTAAVPFPAPTSPRLR
jgi:hypothetical protein